VSFSTITLCVASRQIFIAVVHFIINSVQKLLGTPSYAHVIVHALCVCSNINFHCAEFGYIS
jgi:hypothetical protein